VLRRDWRESRADLMVRTGDQAEERVSRQMAPFTNRVVSPNFGWCYLWERLMARLNIPFGY
jgi:hypothetical protein